MPKDPLSAIAEGLEKIAQVHQKAESVRRIVEGTDPLKTAGDVVDNLTSGINRLDRAIGSTRRRGRKPPSAPAGD